MLHRTFLRVTAASSLALTALVACSLGLDASKLDVVVTPTIDATTEAEAPPDTGTVKPGETACVDDSQCPVKGCFSGRCVPGATGKVCLYEVCPAPSACTHRACVNGACVDPATPHRFLATKMTLGKEGLGCGDKLASCVAIVHPFAFVGHKTAPGPTAYPIVDFTAGDAGEAVPPQALRIEGAEFIVTRIVASGRRVWVIGQPSSSNSVDIAWIDVPVGADQAKLVATGRGFIALNPGDAIEEVFASKGEGIVAFLRPKPSEPRYAAVINVESNNTVSSTPKFTQIQDWNGVAPLLTSSGDRVIAGQAPVDAGFLVEILKGAGTATAIAQGQRDLAALAMGPIFNDVRLASTPLGAVVAIAPTAAVVDGGVVGFDGIEVSWILEGADDNTFEGKPNVALTKYTGDAALPPAPPAALVGPIAALGEDQVMTMTLEGDGGSSLIRVVRKDGGPDPDSQELVAAPHANFIMRGALSGSGKPYGYLLSKPASDTDGIHLQVFDVGCNKL
ncbi:MAG: hypothetical protein IPG50_02525 [Myxococcales bacterium]|nr:hypothetical protein [Myxococcales bacterium]